MVLSSGCGFQKYIFMCLVCSKTDSKGNYNPCCNDGVCEAYFTSGDFSSCIHCGAEMQIDEGGIWRHHSQMELPVNERLTKHFIQQKPLETEL